MGIVSCSGSSHQGLDKTRNELLNSLNKDQYAAVSAPFENHILVLAGAGCGKTSVLTRRIAFCSSQYCSQEAVLALTFTRKAAQEMNSRLKYLPGISPDKDLPTVSTFHGFCLHLLRNSYRGVALYRHLGYEYCPELLSRQNRLKLLATCCTRRDRQFLSVDLLGIDNLISQYAVFPGKFDPLDSEKRSLIARIGEKYRLLKMRSNVWEFSDMIKLIITACDSLEGYAIFVQSHFEVVLVDEYQDTNPVQIELLRHFLGKKTKLFAVGDDDQAIYGFRGADPRSVSSFKSSFPEARVIRLGINYRNRPAILSVANKVFANKHSSSGKILRSGVYNEKEQYGCRPVKKTFHDQRAMIKWMIGQMKALSAARMCSMSEMAVLCRVNESCNRISSALSVSLNGKSSPGVITVHAAKGLEFPVVFVCDLEEGVFPSYRLKKKNLSSVADLIKWLIKRKMNEIAPDILEEERRLFYVAVTRAQQHLFCLSVRRKHHNGRTIKTIPSRFLKYIR